MFVRIQSTDKDGKMHDCLYECKRVMLHPSETGLENEVVLVMEEPDQVVHIDKSGCRMFYMNNDGKTIDSFNW